MRVEIALAQAALITNDKRASIDKWLAWLDRAADEGAQLVVFPELALSGYACGVTGISHPHPPDWQENQDDAEETGRAVERVALRGAERDRHDPGPASRAQP